VFCKWLTGVKLPVPLPEFRIVIEPAFFAVELVWWFDCPDCPCAALLVGEDPRFGEPAGPRANTAVEAKVRVITVMRRRGGLEVRRMAWSPLGVGGFLVEGTSGRIDPSTCHAKSTDDLPKKITNL
jgi:hypothetical protein